MNMMEHSTKKYITDIYLKFGLGKFVGFHVCSNHHGKIWHAD